MNLLKTLFKNQPIFADSACFIYNLEDNKEFGDLSQEIIDNISLGNIFAITSFFTISEVLVKPLREGNTKLVQEYEELLTEYSSLYLAEMSYTIAKLAAHIRALYGFHLIDSYQLAIAIENNCKVFLTNDKQLKKCKEIKVLCLSDFT